ncbi:MAG: WbqC family protein, partial [Bacteroidota bacterium]
LIDLHYLPSIAYCSCLLPYETIWLEAHEHYPKQTYRNRCYILTSQQVDRLTVPVRKTSSKTPYHTLAIDYSQPWPDLHWRALCTAYSKAPYFEYLAEHFRAILFQRHTHLFDLNLALLKTCLQLLQLKKHLQLSSHYEKVPPSHFTDARGNIQPRHRLSPSPYYQPSPYPQLFGHKFHPNLSIIDLLFCEGPHAHALLQQSAASYLANNPRLILS